VRARLSVVHNLGDVVAPAEDLTIAARDLTMLREEAVAVVAAEEEATLLKCAKEKKSQPTPNHNSSTQTMPIIRNLLTA